MSNVKLTCDMNDEEFVAYVHERCNLTIMNTSAGVYMDGLANRLLERVERIAELEAMIDRSGWDQSPCLVCGETVLCLPDGLPICRRCKRQW